MGDEIDLPPLSDEFIQLAKRAVAKLPRATEEQIAAWEAAHPRRQGPREKCRCACHRPGVRMMHFMPCCYDDQLLVLR